MPWRRTEEAHDEDDYSNKSGRQGKGNIAKEKDLIMSEFEHEYGEEEMIEMEDGEAEMSEGEYGGEDENEEDKQGRAAASLALPIENVDEDMELEGGDDELQKEGVPNEEMKVEEAAPDAKEEGPTSISEKMLQEIQKQLDMKQQEQNDLKEKMKELNEKSPNQIPELVKNVEDTQKLQIQQQQALIQLSTQKALEQEAKAIPERRPIDFIPRFADKNEDKMPKTKLIREQQSLEHPDDNSDRDIQIP